MALTIGVFDHMDSSGAPLRDFYENRLKLIEAYDRAGVDLYQVAEHHATPLGMAASPGLYLSAIAQRTKRLRFGPLVYTLPLYHPLRLAEEICMLDQMSGGRLEMGVGRGISPIETRYYGVDPANSEKMFAEAFDVILRALANRTLDFEGEFYRYKDVPLPLEPLQKPHPPLWYGVQSVESAERAAKRGFNAMTNTRTSMVRGIADRYWPNYTPRTGMPSKPRFGMNRFMVIAESEDAALAVARRAYRRWHSSFMNLWNRHGIAPIGVSYPPEFDGQAEDGRALAGTPQSILERLLEQLEETGVNHIGCRFAFGDLTLAESLRSVELFARDVMPGLRAHARVAAE